MIKNAIKFLIITLATSAIYFFSIGGLIGFALTEEEQNIPLIFAFMMFNILFFIAVWIISLRLLKIKINQSTKSYVCVISIPAIIYFVLTLILLILDFALSNNAETAIGTIKYFYMAFFPLGINTVMLISVIDSINSYIYYIFNFCNLIIYTIVIIAVFCRKTTNRKHSGRSCAQYNN